MHTLGSADNKHRYQQEIKFDCDGHVPSKLAVWINEQPVFIFCGGAGLTTLHEHSALLIGQQLFLVVSNYIVCVDVVSQCLMWKQEVDLATCFGVYYHESTQSIITHGELTISRRLIDGHLIWRSHGPDIWTGTFEMQKYIIFASDFYDDRYQIDVINGNVSRITHKSM